MGLQSVNGFISAIASNPELMAKVAEAVTGKSATDAAQAVSELGRLHGFEFTAEDAIQAREAVLQSQSLSEDDLDNVAGGAGLLDQFATKPVGGGIVSPMTVDAAFPPNTTLPAPKPMTDLTAGW